MNNNIDIEFKIKSFVDDVDVAKIKNKFLFLAEELFKCGCKIKLITFNRQIYATSAGGYYEIYLELSEEIKKIIESWSRDNRNSHNWNKVPLCFIDEFKKCCHISSIYFANHYPHYSKYSNEKSVKDIVIKIGCAVVEDDYLEKRGWWKDWDKKIVELFKKINNSII